MTDEDRGILGETASLPRVVVLNKIDLPAAVSERGVAISARTGAGLDDLIAAVAHGTPGRSPSIAGRRAAILRVA